MPVTRQHPRLARFGRALVAECDYDLMHPAMWYTLVRLGLWLGTLDKRK